MVDVSIIIVTYNNKKIAEKTVSSFVDAISGDAKHSYSIIVADNASNDGVADAIGQRYPNVCLIRNQDNLGFSKANNIAFEQSEGRYLLFSNPDIEICKETLPTLIALMDQNPLVAACTPLLRLVSTNGIDWGAHRGTPYLWASFTYLSGLARLFRRSRFLSQIFGRYHMLYEDITQPHEVDVIKGGFFFVRRDVFLQAGKWDEDYFMFGEDVDLCYRIKGLGYKIMFYPQVEVLHHHGVTTGLKRHSAHLAQVDEEARSRAYESFYDSMKIFYDKHLRNEYSVLVRSLVFHSVDWKRRWGRRAQKV